MSRILFLTTESPFPLDSGGKIRTYNLLKGIKTNFEIDLVCFSESEVSSKYKSELSRVCDNSYIIKKIYTNKKSKKVFLKNICRSFFKNKPFIIEKFHDKSYINTIKELLSKNTYEAVIIDHLSIATYIKYLDGKIKVILSQHNCEYLILKRTYENEKNPIKKLYLFNEWKKTERYEKKICSQVNTVVALTEEDKSYLVDKNYNGNNIEIIPISIEINYRKKNYRSKVHNLLFMGTMSWYPNEQGILWFLENVWLDLQDRFPDVNLYIVGKNPSDKIYKYNESKNITVTGYVEDINQYIELCDVAIIPLFIGGGMRVKVLECMAKGIPCISTTIGSEGIAYKNKENIMIADNEKEFINNIQYYNENSDQIIKIKENAFDLIQQYYSVEMIGRKMNSIIAD